MKLDCSYHINQIARLEYDDNFIAIGEGKMLWHTYVMEILFINFVIVMYCLKYEIVLFLPYKPDCKIRVEMYDHYLFQC